MHLMERLWHDGLEPGCLIQKVGVVLSRLCEQGNHTPQLFQDAGGANANAGAATRTTGTAGTDAEKLHRLDAALDKLRARYGRKVIYYGSVQECRDEAPMRGSA